MTHIKYIDIKTYISSMDINYSYGQGTNKPPTKIKGDRIILKGPVNENLEFEQFYKFHAGDGSVPMAEYNLFKSMQDRKYYRDNMWKYMIEGWEDDENAYWSIHNKEDELIGFVDVEFEKETNRTEPGVWLHPDYWGKSYAREAFLIVINYSFVEKDFDVVYYTVATENENSYNFCSKITNEIGGEYVGVIKNAYHIPEKGALDFHHFQITKQQYQDYI